jgi:hypothetical protein
VKYIVTLAFSLLLLSTDLWAADPIIRTRMLRSSIQQEGGFITTENQDGSVTYEFTKGVNEGLVIRASRRAAPGSLSFSDSIELFEILKGMNKGEKVEITTRHHYKNRQSGDTLEEYKYLSGPNEGLDRKVIQHEDGSLTEVF